jgi:hypothetical protein
VQLNESDLRNGVGPVVYQDLEIWWKRSTSFEGMFAYGIISRNLLGTDNPERVTTVRAETGLFHLLGVEPVAGRAHGLAKYGLIRMLR